jgi:hypothetical protein
MPVPYVNVARSSDLAEGTKTVKIEGNPVAIASSNLSASTGDEPGTGGGVVSCKFAGKMIWGLVSLDVKAEGKGVARFMDVTQQNGNTFNTAFKSSGGTGLAYGDDFEGKCPICGKGPKEHRIMETPKFAAIAADFHRGMRATDHQRQIEQQDALALVAARSPNARLARWREDVWGGYMVGVMQTRCCQRLFATTSGHMTASFKDFAEGRGFTVLPPEDPIPDAATLMAVNPYIQTKEQRECFQAAWDDADRRRRRDRRYLRPGRCAGQKLLATGHVPEVLTEFYFDPEDSPQAWRAKYRVLVTRVKGDVGKLGPADLEALLQNERGAWRNKTFQSQGGKPVASCNTCQALLYMLLCDKDRPCPGGP